MRTQPTRLPGVLIIEPRIFSDERGFFKESFSVERYKAVAGIDSLFSCRTTSPARKVPCSEVCIFKRPNLRENL